MPQMELTFTLSGDDVVVSASGGRSGAGEERKAEPYKLGPDFRLDRFEAFRRLLGDAIERGAPAIPDGVRSEAKELYKAVFHDQIRDIMHGLLEHAGGEKLVLRLLIHDPRLQSIPWEALRVPDKNTGYLGVLPDLEVVRNIYSTDPPIAKDVRSTVRILAIAPQSGPAALSTMEVALHGEAITWMPPLMGDKARWRSVVDYLGSLAGGDGPHILHFIGHGRVDNHGVPKLRFADDEPGVQVWKSVESFSRELHDLFIGDLRLVYLEACEGAEPGTIASAAELLVGEGADAVIAHLWKANSDAARLAAGRFYRALTASRDRGNVAACLRAARRYLIDDEEGRAVHALSPVVYLRGNNPVLFTFKKPEVAAAPGPASETPLPAASRPMIAQDGPLTPPAAPLDPALQKVAEGGFSLFVGDYLTREARNTLRAALLAELGLQPEDTRGTTLSTIAQRYALLHGGSTLRELFQRLFGLNDRQAIPALLDALAATLRPGVHISLLWLPLLEDALAAHHPSTPIYVIHPPPLDNLGDAPRVLSPQRDESGKLLRDDRGNVLWARPLPRKGQPALPRTPPLDEAFIVLRLYGGYTAEASPVVRFPLLTEDDYVEDLVNLQDLSPQDWADALKAAINYKPVLFIGLSPLASRHRMLLRKLFEQKAFKGSVAVWSPADGKIERDLWKKEGGVLPRGQIGVLPREDLERYLGILR